MWRYATFHTPVHFRQQNQTDIIWIHRDRQQDLACNSSNQRWEQQYNEQMKCAAICSAVLCGTFWLASPFPQCPRDVEKMKKTGSHSGWCSDTAARKEVKEIRVHSTLHKFFLDSAHQTQNFPIILKVEWLFGSLFWGRWGEKILISGFQILIWTRKFKEGKETSRPWEKREIWKSLPPLTPQPTNWKDLFGSISNPP
jgi:hypothetical protein